MKNFKKQLNKLFAGILAFSIVFAGFSINIHAAQAAFSQAELLEFATEHGITLEEIENFGENFLNALQVANQEMQALSESRNELQSNSRHRGLSPHDFVFEDEVKVQVSENLFLTITNSSELVEDTFMTNADSFNAAGAFIYRASSTHVLRNMFGAPVVNLTAHATFSSVPIPGEILRANTTVIDRFGTFDASFWDVRVDGGAQSGTQVNAWARTSFSGRLAVGIDPISLTLESFSMSGTLTTSSSGRGVSVHWDGVFQ